MYTCFQGFFSFGDFISSLFAVCLQILKPEADIQHKISSFRGNTSLCKHVWCYLYIMAQFLSLHFLQKSSCSNRNSWQQLEHDKYYSAMPCRTFWALKWCEGCWENPVLSSGSDFCFCEAPVLKNCDHGPPPLCVSVLLLQQRKDHRGELTDRWGFLSKTCMNTCCGSFCVTAWCLLSSLGAVKKHFTCFWKKHQIKSGQFLLYRQSK